MEDVEVLAFKLGLEFLGLMAFMYVFLTYGTPIISMYVSKIYTDIFYIRKKVVIYADTSNLCRAHQGKNNKLRIVYDLRISKRTGKQYKVVWDAGGFYKYIPFDYKDDNKYKLKYIK